MPGELGLWVRVQKHLRALLQLISACTSNSRILREPAVRKVQCFSPDLTQSQPEQKHVRDLRTKQASGAISNFKRSAEQFQFPEKLQVTETNRQISLNGIRVAFKVTLNALSPRRTLISECNVLHILWKKNAGNKILTLQKNLAYAVKCHKVALPEGVQNWGFLFMSALQGGFQQVMPCPYTSCLS